MQEEYNYTLTVPLADLKLAIQLLDTAKEKYPYMRLSRKPDTQTSARFYISFPFKGNRTDEQFNNLIVESKRDGWDLFGPNYGVWGFTS